VSIQAIETRYAGCRFRSRLEARWAVVFDQLGIEWEYEPEGFETSAGPYLPDFRVRIPQIKSARHVQWFEVKPPGAPADARHAALAAESGQPVIVARGLPRNQMSQLHGWASPLRAYGELGAAETNATRREGWPVTLVDPDGVGSDLYCSLGDNRHWCMEDARETVGDVHLGLHGLHLSTCQPGSRCTAYPECSCCPFVLHVPITPDYPGSRPGPVDLAFAAGLSARFGA
jgi:hypothetical protein